jgi:hypothetical protein
MAGAVSGITGIYSILKNPEWKLQAASATGKINVGDWLLYSGSFVFAGSGFTPANKASGAGIALESNPQYDSFGNVITASALKYGVGGVYRVSADSGLGDWTLGQPVWASATGSGVAAPTGLTGVGALWQQAAKVSLNTANQAGTAAQIAFATAGQAIVVGFNVSLANSAQLDILLMPARPDYY